MAYTTREKSKLLDRVRRLRGQVDAIERALEGERGCGDVLQLIAAVRGAANGLMGEVLEGHVRLHLAGPSGDPGQAERVEELINVVRTYLK